MDKTPNIMANCMFYEMKKGYLEKNWFFGYLAASAIVEIACIFHIIKMAKKDSKYEK
jgi:hypothetical protein